MSVLGGTRHWAGPAVGAVAITGAALHLHRGRPRGRGQGGDRRDPDRGDPVHARRHPAAAAAALRRRGAVAPRRAGRRCRAVPAPAAASAPSRSAATRAAATATSLLRVRGLHKALPRRAGARRRRRRGAARRDPRPARARTARASRPSSTSSAATTRPSGGRDRLRGPRARRPRRRTASPRAGIARTYQIPRPFGHMTVLDNVALAAMFGGGVRDPGRGRARRRCSGSTSPASQARPTARPDDLNLHQRKFLELARALASRPRLVLLDEVLCGLTPSEIDDAVALIRRIRDQGSTIVFVEHVMRAVMALTDRVVVFNHGELLAEGPAAEVMQRPEVMTAYLGPTPMLEVRDLRGRLRRRRRRCGACRCDVRRRRAALRRRPQRRRQDDPDQRPRRHAARARRPDRASTAATSRALPPHRFCEAGIALVPEGRRLFTGMSVRENLELGSYLPAAQAAAPGVARRGARRCSRRCARSWPARPASSRAASSRWWRSAAR